MGITRTILLSCSQSRWLRERASRYEFVRHAVSRFMPGEKIEAAFDAARVLHERGIATVLTELGENITEAAEAEQVTRHYLDVLDGVGRVGLDAHISVKLTQLGLDLGLDLCHGHLAAIVERAGEFRNFVWIDMEGTAYTDSTIELFRRVRAKHPNVGICLQAYLRRTAQDVAALLPLAPAIRLCKGAYKEPRDRAFARKREVDGNYLALATRLLSEEARRAGARPAFATHDRRLIDRIEALASSAGVSQGAFEIQMLYGIQREEQARLATEGYRVRVLISYGAAWFPWYMRRLAERPANLLFVLRNLLAR